MNRKPLSEAALDIINRPFINVKLDVDICKSIFAHGKNCNHCGVWVKPGKWPLKGRILIFPCKAVLYFCWVCISIWAHGNSTKSCKYFEEKDFTCYHLNHDCDCVLYEESN